MLLVEDHGAVRHGLELYLTSQGLRVVGTAATLAEALEHVHTVPIDVAVVDILLGDASGTNVIQQLRDAGTSARLLVYSAAPLELLAQALEAGAHGFVVKAGPAERLVEAVQVVAAGGRYLDPDFSAEPVEAPTASPGLEVLTRREREVLLLLAQGMTGPEIADRLVVSPATVRTHVQNAMRKLGARTRSRAVVIALQSQSAGNSRRTTVPSP